MPRSAFSYDAKLIRLLVIDSIQTYSLNSKSPAETQKEMCVSHPFATHLPSSPMTHHPLDPAAGVFMLAHVPGQSGAAGAGGDVVLLRVP